MGTPQPPTPPVGAPRRKRDPVAMLLAALLGAVLAAYIVTIELQAGQPQHADFRVFYASTRFLLQGKSIYTPLPTDYMVPGYVTWEGEFLRGNLNPPFQTVLLAPLGLLRYAVAYVIWASLSLLSGVASVWLICRHLGYARPRQLLGSVLVLLVSYGAWHSTASGQFGMVLLFILVLGWIWLQRGADTPAGLILGLVLSLKLFVGVFVLVLAAQRRWRALLWLAVSLLACSAIAAVVAGPESYADYLGILRGVEWLHDGRNASIAGWVQCMASDALGLTSAGAANSAVMVGRIVAAGVLAATTYYAWSANTPDTACDAGLIAGVPAMLLASPLGWIYYFPVLVLPLLWLWRVAGDSGLPRARVALVVFWLLTAAPVVAKDSAWVVSTLPFLGLLGFWGTSVAYLARSKPLSCPQSTRLGEC